LNWLMVMARYAGIGGAIWLALAMLLAVVGEIRFQDFLRLALAIALVHMVVDVALKPWIDRPRPPLTIQRLNVSVDVPESRSFPSGHAANATAAALILTRVWRPMRALVWSAAVLVAVTRVYLGIHYPLDALVGSLAGLACAWVVLRAATPGGLSEPPLRR
jgi:undecaprenyl-diphosphatase